MKEEYDIGIDLGGTYVKATAIDLRGAELFSTQLPSETLVGPEWKENVRRAVAAVEQEIGHSAAGIGVAAPGMAARSQTHIASMPNRMAGLEGLHWQSWLGRTEPVPVLNDAHAALLGEVWCGAAQGCDHVVLLTLGTGVGGAVWSEGKLILGKWGRAGHLGHLCFDPHGPKDVLNTPGSLEWECAEYTLSVRTAGRFSDMKSVLTAVAAGDSQAQQLWQRFIDHLAAGVTSFINIFDPQLVLIGGGVTAAGDTLFTPLRAAVREREWIIADEPVPIHPTQLGNRAGTYGAVWAAQQQRAKRLAGTPLF
jgi:glucokinase